ncbi:hypothetical protein [Thalassotalea sp. PLHSN55]|uniref:hypothetical protein n=1 Tax=Thalassotalea sp. PLHSN55 TaxID=3435888 RepID=UPI003F877381
MNDAFVAHGKFDIRVESNIIALSAQGPWNIEFFDELHHELFHVAATMQEKKYAILLSPIGEAIAVNNSIAYHVDFIRKGKAIAVAVNLEQCDFKALTKHQCGQAYKLANLKHAFFEDEHSARLWLEQQLSA